MKASCLSRDMLFLLFCSSLLLADLTEANTNVFFAGMFPSLPNKARVPGFVLEAGTRLALDHINNDSSILPDYTLNMVTGDSKCDPKVSFNSLVKLLAHPPNILVVFGAACSDATQSLAEMTAKANVAQVSHTSTSLSLSDVIRYPSLYKAIPTDFPAIKASIALLNMFNWSRVAIVGEQTGSGLLETAYEIAEKEMRNNEIDIEWNKVITADQINESIVEIKKQDVRIIIAAVSSAFGKRLMAQAFVSGLYGPGTVWVWLETFPANWWHDTTNVTQHEIFKTVVQYSFGFGDNLNVQDKITNTITGRTPSEIWTEYLQRLGMSFIPPLASYSYDGAWFLAKALDTVVRNHGVKLENITTGNETFYKLLISSLSSVTFTGVTGLFQIYNKDYRERLDGSAHIFQYDQDGRAIEVMEYDVSTKVTTIKFEHGHLWRNNQTLPTDKEPSPTDKEPEKEIHEPEKVKEWIFILLTALCVLGIFVSVVFIAFLIFRCRRKTGRYSAILNIVIAIGSVCLCISGIFYGLRVMDELKDYDETKKICLGQLGLTSIGLTLVLGATISKLLGILQMHDKVKSMKVICGSMVLPLLVFIAVDVVLITLWFHENTPKPFKIFYQDDKTVTSDGVVVPYNEYCSETKYPDWAIMIYIFHSVQVFLVICVAIATRGKSTQEVDDGSFTRWSVPLSLFLFLGVILSDVPSRDSLSSLKISYVIFTSVVSACTLINTIFCLLLKICRGSSSDSSGKSQSVVLKKMNRQSRQ